MKVLKIIAVLCLLLTCPLTAVSQNVTGEDGLTFTQRKQNWLNALPDPSFSISMDDRRMYLISWLDQGIHDDVVSDTILDLINDYWYDGIRAQGGYVLMILLKYGDLGTNIISDADEEAIRDRVRESITTSDYFSHVNPNKQLYAMVGAYLYTMYYEPDLSFSVYGYPENLGSVPSFYRDTWPSFSYNGHTYSHGQGPYNANQLSRDWLMWAMETWYVNAEGSGPREFDSIDYARAFSGALTLLWDLAPDNDPEIIRRAKMCIDLSLLDSILDISANSWGGSMGRADYYWTRRSPIFPTFVYWGMAEDVERFDVKALYHLDYIPPDIIVDTGELSDESDNYFHFHKERNQNWLLANPDYGKWNWVTPNYNIGSNVGSERQGWQVNVKGQGREAFIRFWINEESEPPPDTQEVSYLGTAGRQYRSAIFADIGSKPHLHQRKVDTDWDIEEISGLWQFKKLGKSMVAINLGLTTASVEVATDGVEYSNWTDFKNAIQNNAQLTDTFYITSENITIGQNDYCGLYSPGDCSFPFKRIETIAGNGSGIISWNNNVMTVTKHGRTVVYDYNNWTFSEEYEDPLPGSPSAPSNIKVEAGSN